MDCGVSTVNGHIDYVYKCEKCGSNNGYERSNGQYICDKCYYNDENGDE